MTTKPNYTHIEHLWNIYQDMPRQLAFRAKTKEEWALWREELEKKLIDLLGNFPTERPPLKTIVLETNETPDYFMEKVAFQSDDGVYVPCFVLIPKNVKPPYRPVVSLHGHGSGGADHTLGLITNEETRAQEEKLIKNFNYDYSRKLAQRGYMVFVPGLSGFGERMETLPYMTQTLYTEYGNPMWKSSCRSIAFISMMLGKTVNGIRVWDVMRTIDYIRSRPEPMINGVGCLGLSGGGMTTLYSSAVEPRITVSVINGYFSSYRASIMGVFHCECNYIPGIAKYAEMSDIAGLIAPRPLLIVSGTDDDLFPVDAVESGYRELKKVYDLLGVPERLDNDIYKGGHRFSDNKAFDWLDKWLQ